MLTLPAPVLSYLMTHILAKRSPAYLFVSTDGYLKDWGGQLNNYGIFNIEKEAAVNSQLFFLEGLLPLHGAELFLPGLKTSDGICADVHLFPGADGDWVLLLDATLDELQDSLLQQYRNDLSLLQTRQAKLLNQRLSQAPVELLPLLLPLQPGGERRSLTVLFVALRNFLPYSEQNLPEAVFSVLNLYLRGMMESIAAEAGIINQFNGDAVMACFGVRSASESPANSAVRSALKMLKAVEEINRLRHAENQPTFEISIGIASGLISLGMLGNQYHKALGAIGYSVDLAARLQQQADPGEALIDANTFHQSQQQQQFSLIDRSVEGLAEPIQIYSLIKR